MQTHKTRTSKNDIQAARLLLLGWTGCHPDTLDPRRTTDLAQLLSKHRGGLVFNSNGDWSAYAETRHSWKSGNTGTARRLLQLYAEELADPSDIAAELNQALKEARAGAHV